MSFSEDSRLTIPVSDADHIQGNENTTLTLVEYGDFECGHCVAVYPVVHEVQREFGDALRFVYRNFPIVASHPNAQRAAEAAEAAGDQGKFWEMHGALFTRESHLSPELIDSIAEAIGVDMDRFTADLENRTFEARVQEQFMGGVRSGVNGTPTFFVNDRRYDGPPTFEAMSSALNAIHAASQ